MPMYLNEAVSDEYLQGLIGAYRDGYTDAGGDNVEDSDQPIIDRLEAKGIKEQPGAKTLGAADAKREQDADRDRGA